MNEIKTEERSRQWEVSVTDKTGRRGCGKDLVSVRSVTSAFILDCTSIAKIT